jgi:hypothetical protein
MESRGGGFIIVKELLKPSRHNLSRRLPENQATTRHRDIIPSLRELTLMRVVSNAEIVIFGVALDAHKPNVLRLLEKF